MPQTAPAPRHYRTPYHDSARWTGFPFRDGDIVISTRTKSGTTWMQMICALLAFGSADLPAPLTSLSPWLESTFTPRDDMFATLAAQRHRRFIKSHTPLDGIPRDERVTYIVVARHPLDMMLSLYHHGANLDLDKIRRVTGADGIDDVAERPDPHEAMLAWIDHDMDPGEELDYLPGIFLHLTDAWARRHEPNVLLVHYDDLSSDLDGEMRRIAQRLGVEVADEQWPDLVDAAGFKRMRARADELAPDPGGILKDSAAFFRDGKAGSGRALLTAGELAHYRERTAAMAPADLLEWLHRD